MKLEKTTTSKSFVSRVLLYDYVYKSLALESCDEGSIDIFWYMHLNKTSDNRIVYLKPC